MHYIQWQICIMFVENINSNQHGQQTHADLDCLVFHKHTRVNVYVALPVFARIAGTS